MSDEFERGRMLTRVCGNVQRLVGDRSYKSMWRRYKYRVLLAMSSQMFAQLVSLMRGSYQNEQQD